MVKYLQREFMTEEIAGQLRHLLFSVTDILARHDLLFWLDCGTLLGAFRCGELISGDADVDLRIMHRDWRLAYDVLNAELPEGLSVTAHHHGSVIQGLGEDPCQPWFENADGRFFVSGEAEFIDGRKLHSATALSVHATGAVWDSQPNLDLYCCKINEHHDCTPNDWSRPWEEDGRRYLCVPAEAPQHRNIPCDYVLPLGEANLEGRSFPAPGRCKEYLEHLYGYIGVDAIYDFEACRWVRSETGKPNIK